MKMKQYVDEILLKLGGGVVKIELEDNNLVKKVVNAALREIQRYINIVKYETISYAPVIDLSDKKVYSITQVLRAEQTSSTSYDTADAIYLAMNSYVGGMSNMTDYRTYLRYLQLKSTLKTDLAFNYDEMAKKLYIVTSSTQPSLVTIVYVPKISKVEELDSPYWEDMLMRLSLALCKETLGRIRGKYKLDEALYSLDADQLLQEGQQELTELREHLQANSDLTLPID